MNSVTANGKPVAAQLPCTLEQFLVAQKLLRTAARPRLPLVVQRLSLQP